MARKLQSRKQFIKVIGFNGSWEDLVGYADAVHRNQDDLLYREWDQKKPGRPKEKRRIEQPLGDLPKLQGALAFLLENKLELHECVQGSVKGKSSLSNALVHAGNNHFFGVDIRRFYPSVRHPAVYEVYTDVMSPELAAVATRLSTLKGRLPTGASTSPILGNLVLRDMDTTFLDVAREYGLSYSRYVDDITFSGRSDFSDHASATILEIIRSNGYVPHLRKTRYTIGGSEVTGVNIKNNRLSPTKNQRDRLTTKKRESGEKAAESAAGMRQYMKRVGKANNRR